MKLYKCTRYPYSDIRKDKWMGSLLILADNVEEAEKIFTDSEHGRIPEQIIEIEMTRGILHDDFMR
jgi:hypothetical protein